MGYRAEKEKIEKKLRVIRLATLCVVLAAVVGLCVFSAFCPPATWKYYVKKPDVVKREDGELRVHFLDVGQGDCTLIELPDGKVALIDGGDSTDRTKKTVLRYLNALKIKTIDYLIVTHADSDHCGSLATLLQQKTVLNAYLPTTNPTDAGGVYASMYQELLEQNTTKIFSARGEMLADETAPYTFSFVYPYAEDVESDVGESSVAWLDYKGISFIFMADATVETEEKLIRDSELNFLDNIGVDLRSTEIIKIGHHGSETSSSLEFLQYLQVKEAVVSCGKNNPYNHPRDKVLENVATAGADLYRTDENGTVVVSVKDVGCYSVKTTK